MRTTLAILALTCAISVVAAADAQPGPMPGQPPMGPQPGMMPGQMPNQVRPPVLMPEGLEACAAVPQCLEIGATWITARECMVVGVVTNPAQAIPEGAILHAPQDPGAVWVKANDKWFKVTVSQVKVRPSAIATIDGRAGSNFGFPPSQAVPGGARLMAQPQAQGITLTAGVTRVFCGVRSFGDVDQVDFTALCKLFKIPTPDEIVNQLK